MEKRVVDLLGIPIHDLTYAEVLDQISGFVASSGKHRIATVNPEFIVHAQKDKDFQQILKETDINVADGVGVIWAGNLLGKGLRERVTGTDLVEKIAAQSQTAGWRLFLLGGRHQVGSEAAKLLKIRYPDTEIIGSFEGDSSPGGDDEVLRVLNQAGRIDILLVAYGHPYQEKWIARNLPKIDVKVALGVGGALDYLSGQKERAPEWMRSFGLEWLARLVKEPWRWRRQLAIPLFVFLVFKEKIRLAAR